MKPIYLFMKKMKFIKIIFSNVRILRLINLKYVEFHITAPDIIHDYVKIIKAKTDILIYAKRVEKIDASLNEYNSIMINPQHPKYQVMDWK